MKNSLILALVLLLLAAPAAAQIVGQTPQEDYIHRYTAKNGQEIYYVSREDEWATVQEEDVNFDGHDDLVFLVTLGATNAFFEFWVWDESENAYVLAGRNALFETGLPNYELYPELGLVATYGSNGFAGLLHEKHIFRWNGNDLKLVRYAIADTQETMLFEDDLIITIANTELLHVRVFECVYGGDNREDNVIFEQMVSHSEPFDEQALLQAESEALWQGLR